MITPKEVYKILEESVIGQARAKKIMSTAMYSHYIRCMHPEAEIEKSNIIVAGPTGVGKTLIAKTLAKNLNLPIAIADATSLTQAGYVGEDVENCLLRLIHAANGDVKLAERGVIVIDEIDKLARKGESASITRDVSGEGVQQALLKIIEGTVANVPAGGGRKRPDGIDYIPINTTNILFICSGAFEGIPNRNELTPDDFIQYGMMPELMGRLPVIAKLNQLTEAELVSVLVEPKNSIIQQYKNLFNLSNCKLEFDPSAYKAIANYALERRIGARGLRALLEKILLDYQFELPEITEVKLDGTTVQQKLGWDYYSV